MKKLIIGMSLMTSLNSFALTAVSDTRSMEVIADVESNSFIMRVCEIKSNECVEDIKSVDELVDTINIELQETAKILSDETSKEAFKEELRAGISKNNVYMHPLLVRFGWAVRTIEEINYVIDTALPQVLKQITVLDYKEMYQELHNVLVSLNNNKTIQVTESDMDKSIAKNTKQLKMELK